MIKPKQSKRDREKLQPLFNIPPLNTPWQSSELCALDTLEYLTIQSIKKVWKILFSRGEKPLNPAQFVTCPPSVFRHSRQPNSALSGPKFRAGGQKFCTGPIICTSSKFCLVLDLIIRSRPNQITGPGPKSGPAGKSESRGPENGVSRWRRQNSDIYSQNYHFDLISSWRDITISWHGGKEL